MQWPKRRSWGWYATLIRAPWFCLKLLRFKPRGELSMQRHKHRVEIWCFIKGIGELESPYAEWDYSYKSSKNFSLWKIPPNTWHRFTALDKPVYAIELQYGKKVTESDIERKA